MLNGVATRVRQICVVAYSSRSILHRPVTKFRVEHPTVGNDFDQQFSCSHVRINRCGMRTSAKLYYVETILDLTFLVATAVGENLNFCAFIALGDPKRLVSRFTPASRILLFRLSLS